MAKRPSPDVGRVISSELAHDTAFLLTRARNACQAVTTRLLARLDLRPRHYAVPTLACSPQPPTQRELATFLTLDPGQIVALVDPLEDRGLVERRVDEFDLRNKSSRAS